MVTMVTKEQYEEAKRFVEKSKLERKELLEINIPNGFFEDEEKSLEAKENIRKALAEIFGINELNQQDSEFVKKYIDSIMTVTKYEKAHKVIEPEIPNFTPTKQIYQNDSNIISIFEYLPKETPVKKSKIVSEKLKNAVASTCFAAKSLSKEIIEETITRIEKLSPQVKKNLMTGTLITVLLFSSYLTFPEQVADLAYKKNVGLLPGQFTYGTWDSKIESDDICDIGRNIGHEIVIEQLATAIYNKTNDLNPEDEDYLTYNVDESFASYLGLAIDEAKESFDYSYYNAIAKDDDEQTLIDKFGFNEKHWANEIYINAANFTNNAGLTNYGDNINEYLTQQNFDREKDNYSRLTKKTNVEPSGKKIKAKKSLKNLIEKSQGLRFKSIKERLKLNKIYRTILDEQFGENNWRIIDEDNKIKIYVNDLTGGKIIHTYNPSNGQFEDPVIEQANHYTTENENATGGRN